MKRFVRQNDDGWSEHGGYMHAKKTKLDDQFSLQKTTLSNLFHGVSIYVNGYTVPSALELRSLIRQHGGRYKSYYSRSSVTHIIASQLPTSKINRLTDQKVVRANWITDSIRAGKCLPWQHYQLYPERLGGAGQQRLQIVPAHALSDEGNPSNQCTAAHLCPDHGNSLFANAMPDGDDSTGTIYDESESSLAVKNSGLAPNRARRVQQMRLDACLSPPKHPTNTIRSTNEGVCVAGPSSLSLKQLLKMGSNPSTMGNEQLSFTESSKTTELPAPTVTINQTCSPVDIPVVQLSTSSESNTRATDRQLATFYARSRLHHLSSWANELRELVRRVQGNPNHTCDLGSQWKQSILTDLTTTSSTDLESSLMLRLEARAFGQSASVPPAPPPLPRILFHIDMDCFFVSVSLRNRPDLKDKPVAVTHAKQRDVGQSGSNRFTRDATTSMSEIASCSYAARQAGCRNGMLLGRAKQLCPDLQTVPYDFDAYKTVSEQLYTIISRFTLDIEAVSCDELYADCTDLLTIPTAAPIGPRLCEGQWCFEYTLINPLVLASHLRELVYQQTDGCTASIGFGTTRLLARLATKRAKPNGQWFLLGVSGNNPRMPLTSVSAKANKIQWHWCRLPALDSDTKSSVSPKEQQLTDMGCELTGKDDQWFRELPLQELPGIGHVLVERLSAAFAVHTCGELMRTATRDQLISLLGAKTGARIYDLCRARDEAGQLQLFRSSKSVSACMNYGIRLQSHADLESLVYSLCQELVSRMSNTVTGSSNSHGVLGRCLTVRVFIRAPNAPVESAKFMGHGLCTKASRMHSFPEPTADVSLLCRSTLNLLRRLCPDPKELRGLGLQMHKLVPAIDHSFASKPIINQMYATTTTPIVTVSPPTPLSMTFTESSTQSFADAKTVQSTPGPAVVTPQRNRRRSLRLKQRSTSRESNSSSSRLSSMAMAEDGVLAGHSFGDEAVSKIAHQSPCDTALLQIPCIPPTTPNDLNKNDFQMEQSNRDVPSSTPIPTARPHRAVQSNVPMAITARQPTKKRARGGRRAPRSRTIRQALLRSPTKTSHKTNTDLKTRVAEDQPGALTQALSNPTGLFEGKTLEQLKQIFADWITSEPYPLIEDVCILASYLVRLVPFNLERVRRCLIILDRLITQLTESRMLDDNPSDWRCVYRRISETVSLSVEQSYGYVKLQLRSNQYTS